MHKYDVVILGSGLGGLLCGAILGKHGYRVCVLEKNRQIGGCLQTFARDKVLFDSGVHYIGGLAQGQTLYQLFKYLGILEYLELEQLDQRCFDKIIFAGDPKEYRLAQGYDNFKEELLKDFPNEAIAIDRYLEKLQDVCARFPLYNLRNGEKTEKDAVLGLDTWEFLNSITTNNKLKHVLAGNNMLYVGQPKKTPFYVHALVQNSYIESSWKCKNGGSQIAKWLARKIVDAGGAVKNRAEVTKIRVHQQQVQEVLLKDGSSLSGTHYISNIHPCMTIRLLDGDDVRPAYKNRIENLENSIAGFIVNIVMKPGTFRYFNHNYYYHHSGDAWSGLNYNEDNWPLTYAMFVNEAGSTGFAESISLMTYMKYEDVAPWQESYNTEDYPTARGAGYEAFKEEKTRLLLDRVEERFPGFKSKIHNYYTATPLSFRDYIGTSDGSMYGVVKDCNDPMRTFIAPKTKIKNLFLTGQNLNLHGILGVSMTAVLTSAEFLGLPFLVDEIRNA
ncbi:all-trans-retinol 13,14-reductase [Chitinophaga caeni]|uniref:All-trans-retinol 13,14-reductase n=1 Tax=Chitinophaga caeni TaxID=2029983 RepID=A0A291QUT1_9BACT|nr:NAD(P)-binding protein [Chitinophaga caeni]ATL47604.1 all-trans-retinol 13,14-reductase [Chitinophaga caeni]